MAEWNAKANDVFLGAAEVESPAERRLFLDRHCGGDADLRAQVESLLAASAKVGSFLNEPAVQALPGSRGTADYEPIAERPGTVIGPYKLMEQIGEGGMGLVFVAEQQHPVRRKVALKVIKPGMDSREVIARFEAERQALALMDHPNIAKVFDAGTTESGRPYFVMELVKGIPIVEYCDQQQLTARERLELFLSVCQAVQHAHGKGVIHRDLKPNNILVAPHDGVPVVKVIDFGVAKAIGQQLTDKTIYTRFTQMIGTPLYMSPEQAEINALDVDIRSDVYSLGVLLYELLTGTTPFDRQRFATAAYDEIRRIIREEEPPKPSTRLSTLGETLSKVSAQRKTEPAKLSALVKGDLDWIVMKALEKDRNRRYETASAFAADVRRFLADDPVEARPPSTWYRFRKLARRNKAILTTAALVGLALVAGTVVSTWQAVRATRAETQARATEDVATKERDRARTEKENTQATLEFVWEDVLFQASPWQVADRKLTLRTMIDRAAARLDAGTGRPPLVEATLRRMLGAIYTEMGELEIAKRFLEEARKVQSRELAEDDPELLETNYHYGRWLCILDHYDDAAAILGRNVELRLRRSGVDNKGTLIAMRWAAWCYGAQGRYAEGDRLFREGLDALSRVPEYQAVGRVLYRYCLALTLVARGDLRAGEAELKGCLEDAREAGVSKDHPYVISAKRHLAWVYLQQDDPARAEPLAVEALAHMRAVMGEQHPFTLRSIWVLARIYLAQARYAKAGPLIEDVVERSRQRPEEGLPGQTCGFGMQGQLLVAQKKYAEAEEPLRKCLALWEKRLPQGGYISFLLSKRGAAREYAFAKCLLGASLLGQKKYDEAEQLLLDGYDDLKARPEFAEDATPYAQRSRVEALGWLVQLYEETDEPDDAAKWRKILEEAKAAQKSTSRSSRDGSSPKPQVLASNPPAAKPISADLVAAIRDGNKDAISKLLDNGADVNACDVDGNTPLLLAAVYAGPECVELLLKKGADANAVNKLGVTPLHRAATSYEKAKLLIDASANVKVTTKSGRTPLTLAARKAGNSKTVQLLLEKGADAKERNARGFNPIQAAAACGDLDTVKLLVEAGADVNDFTPSPRPYAINVRTPLGWAASHNDLPLLRYLLERKADPNKVTLYGTPLTFAAFYNNALAADILLAHGAKTDVKSPYMGTTPLHWAAGNDSPRPEFVQLLLKHGADPNAEYGEQFEKFLGVPQTPRLLAEKRGQTAQVEALAAAGAKAPPKLRPAQRPVKPVAEKPDAQLIRDSAESAIRLLQESAVVSIESSGRHASRQGRGSCLTCHQHYLPLAAMGQAKDRAVRLDRDALTRLGDQVAADFDGMDIAEVDFKLDQASDVGYPAFGLIGDHRPASAVTDRWVHRLAVIQAADGRWPAFAARPPIQASDVSTTALAVQAIKHFGWPGRKAEFDAAVDRGRKWLWTVKAETTEEAAYQLLGLHWAGEPAEKLADLAKALLSQQRKDGGWAQLPKLESDAYATGQALYALSHAAKHPATSRDWQQGLRYLLGTQCDDGSWHVVSRAYPFQPTMASGFPHGRDSWISAAGTSWAVLAMTEALPPGTTTEKPTAVARKPKDAPPVRMEMVDFTTQIKPLLERSCVACHGHDKQRSNFRLDSREALLKGGTTGSAVVMPGKSAQSTLLDYVSGRVEGMEMPPMPKRDKFAAFTKEEVELLRAWIEQGAVWPKDAVLSSLKTERPR